MFYKPKTLALSYSFYFFLHHNFILYKIHFTTYKNMGDQLPYQIVYLIRLLCNILKVPTQFVINKYFPKVILELDANLYSLTYNNNMISII